MDIDYSNPLHVEAARGLLSFACGRGLFCGCGKVLDRRTAVQWTFRSGESAISHEIVACGSCFDSPSWAKGGVSDVLDGRLLWPKVEPKPKAPPRRNVAHHSDLKVGDRVELRLRGNFVPVVIRAERGARQGAFSRRAAHFIGTNERTGRDVRFTAAKVRAILSKA